jgi:uncharacterized protein (TIGR03086 family)
MTESTGIPDVVATYDRVSAALQELVAGVRPEQWSAPTPCTEWDVRALVNHVVGGTRVFIANIRGTELPDRSSDFLGEDPVAAFAAAAADLHDAFVAPGVMDGVFPSPLGQLPGRFLVQMRITEQIVHGWDLGQATGQRLAVPDDLVEATLAGLRQAVPGGERPSGPFRDEQPAAPDAPAIDRLAAFAGRRVSA